MATFEQAPLVAIPRAIEALAQLVDVAEDMLPYVPTHFREKWGYDQELADARTVLDRLRSNEKGADRG